MKIKRRVENNPYKKANITQGTRSAKKHKQHQTKYKKKEYKQPKYLIQEVTTKRGISKKRALAPKHHPTGNLARDQTMRPSRHEKYVILSKTKTTEHHWKKVRRLNRYRSRHMIRF